MTARVVDRQWVNRRRLAVQRLSSSPLPHAADAVRLLTCVQSQDAPLAAHSLAMRSRDTRYAEVVAAQARGDWVRTHILRPTWHFVAPRDLRWIQALTGPKVERSDAARLRQLGITADVMDAGLDLLREVLADGAALSRAELGPIFAERGLPSPGEALAHQLIVAEVRAVICSGAPRLTGNTAEHTYALVDEVIPAVDADSWPREHAACMLTHRFYAGHGPASERDLQRWSGLTLTEIRSATAELTSSPTLRDTHPLEAVELDGDTLWFDPRVPARTTRRQSAYLLSTFDEAALTYPASGFPRRDAGADRVRMLSQAARGVIIVDGSDVGTFGRTIGPHDVRVTIRAEVDLSADARDAIAHAAQFLADFHDRPLRLDFS